MEAVQTDTTPREEIFTGPLLEERIRQRAHELFVQRGDEPGSALGDWLEAEREIMLAAEQRRPPKAMASAQNGSI
jgi:hypothetical protein